MIPRRIQLLAEEAEPETVKKNDSISTVCSDSPKNTPLKKTNINEKS